MVGHYSRRGRLPRILPRKLASIVGLPWQGEVWTTLRYKVEEDVEVYNLQDKLGDALTALG